jgi:hypothetical protein
VTENPDLSKIIERIRKLLALTESANEHEAALAAAKASELLATYELDMATVEGHLRADAPTVQETDGLHFSGTRTRWQVDLADGLASHNGCKAIFGKRSWWLIGTPAAIQVVSFMFDQLSTRLKLMVQKASQEHIAMYRKLWEADPEMTQMWGKFHHTKIGRSFGREHSTVAYHHSWMQGAVMGINRQLYLQRREFERSGENAKALMVVTSKAVAEKVKELHPRLGSLSFYTSMGAGHRDGFEAGRNMALHGGLGAGKSSSQIGGKR